MPALDSSSPRTPRLGVAALVLFGFALALGMGVGCEPTDSGHEQDGADGSRDTTPSPGADAVADTSTTGDPADGEPDSVRGITAAHNRVREETGAGLPPLTWSAEVAAFAQQWADELGRRGCSLEHRPRSGEFQQRYGENLFWGSGSGWSAQQVVGSWASEASDYDYASNSCSGVCGHYTQIVWRDSLRLGCATTTCDGGGQVWVCNYDPPGNYIGQRPY